MKHLSQLFTVQVYNVLGNGRQVIELHRVHGSPLTSDFGMTVGVLIGVGCQLLIREHQGTQEEG